MDWISVIVNEHAAAPSTSMDLPSSKQDNDEGLDKSPNFDHLLRGDGHHTPPRDRRPPRARDRPSRFMNGTGPRGDNNDDSRANDKAYNPTDGSPAPVNVRIHETEMQRYLHGLVNGRGGGDGGDLPPIPSDTKSKLEMLRQLKSSLGVDNGGAVDKKPFLQGGGNNSGNNGPFLQGGGNGGNNSGGQSSSNSGGGGGGTGSLAPLGPTQPPPKEKDEDGGNKSNSRQKNDKAVEVLTDGRVIARFRTQTECARYLRATPEAVSYHCSKGGGVCNGLVIRPLGTEEVARLTDESSRPSPSGSSDAAANKDAPRRPPFGLFDGAVLLRPKERPQLKPETVAILKDWLLSPDHVDNPYPNQRESEMLMERTGLDRTQLKHWFNNARKRILKPLLKSGGRAVPVPPKKRDGERGDRGPKKKRRTDMGMGGDGNGMMAPSPAMGGVGTSVSSDGTNHTSNVSSRQDRMLYEEAQMEERRLFERRQQQLLAEERQRVRPRQFDDPFLDARGGALGRDDVNDDAGNGMMMNNAMGNNGMMGNNSMMSNMMSMNQMDRLMAMKYGMNNGMSGMGGMRDGMGGMRDGMGGMMGNMGGMRDGMGGMRDGMGGMRDSMGGMRDGMGGMRGMMGNMGGMRDDMSSLMGNMGGMRGDMGRMMGFGDSMRGGMNPNSSRNSFNDSHGSSSLGGGGFQGRGNGGMGGGFQGCMEVADDRVNEGPSGQMNVNKDSRLPQDRLGQDRPGQDGCGDTAGGGGSNPDDGQYCQPLGPQGGGPTSDLARDGPGDSAPSDDASARSNAVFKQQVATMAMNEASAAFRDMEDAFAHAKGVLAAARTGRTRLGDGDPEDDPLVVEANARARKCQGVAMFKLKVSQRASEEAASAYDSYQRMVEEMGLGGGGGGMGEGGAGPGAMAMPGDSPFP